MRLTPIINLARIVWPIAFLLAVVGFILGIWFDGKWALTALVLIGLAIVSGAFYGICYDESVLDREDYARLLKLEKDGKLGETA